MSVAETLTPSLDAALTAIPRFDDPAQDLVAIKCRALMVGYHNRWKDAGYTPVQVEQIVTADLMNPETQRKSRTFRSGGKLDVIAKNYNGRGVMDHKTTSDDISDPNATIWAQLEIEGQPSHYSLLEWQNGRKLDWCVWDVMRKPQTRPKKLSKAERASVVSSRKYFGMNVSQTTLDLLQITESENYELYELRLIDDCTIQRPEWFFQRKPVPRLDSELLQYANELWEHGQEILHARNTGRHARNSGACLLYGSPCKFLGICTHKDNPNSEKWVQKTNVHVELPGLEGDGRDLLTNSRIRCFQTCRQKHYLQYELGIERYDEEEREVLFFGHLWHSALEAWWKSFMKGEDHGDDCKAVSAANGVAETAARPIPSPSDDAVAGYW